MEKSNVILMTPSAERLKQMKKDKIKKNVINGFLCLSIMVCLFSVGWTSFSANDVANAAETSNGLTVVPITGYAENQVVVEDGTRYFYEGAKETIENIDIDGATFKAIIVNGKCTSILTDTTTE